MRTPVQEAFLSIIRYEIAGTPLPEGFIVPDMEALLELSEKQDLTHLVYDALTRNGIPCSSQKALKQYYAALWRVEQMDHEYQRMCGLFEEHGIDFIPLKGSVTRSLYPQRWMRTSADIDLLFRAEQEKEAEELMAAELGYEYAECGDSIAHGNLFSPVNHIHIEPHRTLFHDLNTNGNYVELFNDIWNRAQKDPDGSGHKYKMSDSDTYTFIVAHTEKHLHHDGGCSIKSLLDIWLMDRMPAADRNGRADMIGRADLTRFESIMKGLICSWMDGRPAESESLEQFILKGEMYTSWSRNIVLQTKNSGRFRYYLGRVFMPLDEMKLLYPVLNDHPLLLPVMWIKRWTKLTDKDTMKRVNQEVHVSINADKEELKEINEISDYLGWNRKE